MIPTVEHRGETHIVQRIRLGVSFDIRTVCAETAFGSNVIEYVVNIRELQLCNNDICKDCLADYAKRVSRSEGG